jgi:hypothetical protein
MYFSPEIHTHCTAIPISSYQLRSRWTRPALPQVIEICNISRAAARRVLQDSRWNVGAAIDRGLLAAETRTCEGCGWQFGRACELANHAKTCRSDSSGGAAAGAAAEIEAGGMEPSAAAAADGEPVHHRPSKVRRLAPAGSAAAGAEPGAAAAPAAAPPNADAAAAASGDGTPAAEECPPLGSRVEVVVEGKWCEGTVQEPEPPSKRHALAAAALPSCILHPPTLPWADSLLSMTVNGRRELRRRPRPGTLARPGPL